MILTECMCLYIDVCIIPACVCMKLFAFACGSTACLCIGAYYKTLQCDVFCPEASQRSECWFDSSMTLNSLSWFHSLPWVAIRGLQDKHTAGFASSQKQTHNPHWYLWVNGQLLCGGFGKTSAHHLNSVFTEKQTPILYVCALIEKRKWFVSHWCTLGSVQDVFLKGIQAWNKGLLDSYMCMWERERRRKRGGEREWIYVC